MADSDATSRQLLTRTDALLDRVEQLRLEDASRLPLALKVAIQNTASSIGLKASAPPATLGAAHCYLLRLQGVLMAGRARAQTRAVPTAAAIEPADVRIVPRIALPRRSTGSSEADWHAAIRLRVQRAYDAARYLDAQSAAAAIGWDHELIALRQIQADHAQHEFEQLITDAEQLVGHKVTLDRALTVRSRGRLALDDLVVDFEFRSVLRQGRRVKLGTVEFGIVAALVSNPGRVVTREALMRLAYGDDPAVDVRSRRIDVHLAHLRDKVGGLGFVETVHSIGWRVSDRPASRDSDESDPVRQQRREARRARARRDATGRRPEPPEPPPGPDRWSVRRLR